MKSYRIEEYGGETSIVVKKWDKACEDFLGQQQLPVVFNRARGYADEDLL